MRANFSRIRQRRTSAALAPGRVCHGIRLHGAEFCNIKQGIPSIVLYIRTRFTFDPDESGLVSSLWHYPALHVAMQRVGVTHYLLLRVNAGTVNVTCVVIECSDFPPIHCRPTGRHKRATILNEHVFSIARAGALVN